MYLIRSVRVGNHYKIVYFYFINLKFFADGKFPPYSWVLL